MNPTEGERRVRTRLPLISFFCGLVFYAPVALLVRTQAGITVSQFFTLQVILSVGILLFEIPAGLVSDRLGYKRTMVLSYLLLFAARVLLLVSGSYRLFALEAVIEALSISFMSGTDSAYIYSYCKDEGYALFSSRVGRAGTAGFILSTLLYSLILAVSNVAALVAATCATTLLALIISLTLPPERESPASAEMKRPRGLPLSSSAGGFILLLSAVSVAYLVINFFYAVKVDMIGFRYELLSAVIIGYSIVELAAPTMIRLLRKEWYKKTVLLLLILGAAAFFLIYRLSTALCIPLMLVTPLLLSVMSYLTDELVNEWIDERGLDSSRATILSILSMGSNVLDTLFLLASAVISDNAGNSSFAYVSAYFSIVFIIASALWLIPRKKQRS